MCKGWTSGGAGAACGSGCAARPGCDAAMSDGRAVPARPKGSVGEPGEVSLTRGFHATAQPASCSPYLTAPTAMLGAPHSRFDWRRGIGAAHWLQLPNGAARRPFAPSPAATRNAIRTATSRPASNLLSSPSADGPTATIWVWTPPVSTPTAPAASKSTPSGAPAPGTALPSTTPLAARSSRTRPCTRARSPPMLSPAAQPRSAPSRGAQGTDGNSKP